VKVSKRSAEKQGDTTVYRVPLFTCSRLKGELEKDGLDLATIQKLGHSTLKAEFENNYHVLVKAVLACFPKNKPSQDGDQLRFCDECPKDKELWLRVTVKDCSETFFAEYALKGGSAGLQFKLADVYKNEHT